MPQIFPRTNSAAVSFDSWLVSRSVKQVRKAWLLPCSHIFSYWRVRSSGDTASAERVGLAKPARPNTDSRAACRFSGYTAL